MKTGRKSKKSDSTSKLVLEEIIGLTTKNGNGLASSVSTNKCVYVAGCVVVVYNVDSCTQSHIMVSHRLPKPLSCVALSQDGRFVAAGESGHQPAVLVWDCATLAFISELRDHLCGVACIAFSPNGKHLVSVGGYICLWDWRSGMLVTKLKASSSCSAVESVSFSLDAKFIITAGKKHLKFWSVGSSPGTRLNKGTGSLTIHSKPVNLGVQKGSSFISVTSPIWTDSMFVNGEQAGDFFPVYALTDSGVLCLVHFGFSVKKSVDLKVCVIAYTLYNKIHDWFQKANFCLVHFGFSVKKSVDLKVEKGFALSSSYKLIACACSNGIVQIFTIESLMYVGSVLYPKAKRYNGESESFSNTKDGKKDFQVTPTLPDAIACQFSTSEKLVVVYGDHSLHIWDIRDVDKATRCCVLVSHSACIWDIKNICCENMHDPSLACVARGCSGGVSFATCSTDGSIRLWDLDLGPDSLDGATDHHSLNTERVGTTHLVSAGIFERDTVESGVSNQGFRSMAVSSDGKYLAAGDCEGNLHIYDLCTSDYTCFQNAHDAEILSLSFSLSSKKDVTSEEDVDSPYFLITGGRDRIIHLYDAKRSFDLIESIEDHSAAVTSVKFTCNGSKILSCSADRSLVFRDLAVTDSGYRISRCHHQMASHGTVYDMAVDLTTEVAVTVGQDKKINTYDIASGKLIRSFKQDKDYGDPIKVTMDPSCSYLVCSYSNKSICIYDFLTGELVTQAMGHSEVITGVIFLPDCKHIISVGGDGCIFVWKLPTLLTSRMLQRVKEKSGPLSPKRFAQPVAFSQIMFCQDEDEQCRINLKDVSSPGNSSQVGNRMLLNQKGGPQQATAFKFSISRLPKWAQAKVTSSYIVPGNPEFTSSKQVELKIFSPSVGDDRGYTPVSPDVQTPSKNDVGGNNSCATSFSRSSDTNSRSSEMPQKTQSSAMDKRWLTIYTVCMDLLNSPEVLDLKETTMPVSSVNSLQDMAGRGSNADCSSWRDFPVINDEQGVDSVKYSSYNKSDFMWECNNQLDQDNTSVCHEAVAGIVPEQFLLDKSVSLVQAALDNNACHMNFEESDLFNQHFGNLSAMQKIDRRKSSVKRRYSSRFVVQRDYLKGSKILFDEPIQDFGSKTLNCGEEAATHVTLDPSLQVLEERKIINSSEKDLNSSQILLTPSQTLTQNVLTKLPATENSINVELIEKREKKDRIFGGSEGQERIVACREALLSLDAAAESAVQLFSNLGTMVSKEELSSEPGTKLHNEAAEMLQSISEKVNTISKLVQCSNNDPCGGNQAEVPNFEPLLGTFAESLSQRVVEILRNNLSSV